MRECGLPAHTSGAGEGEPAGTVPSGEEAEPKDIRGADRATEVCIGRRGTEWNCIFTFWKRQESGAKNAM